MIDDSNHADPAGAAQTPPIADPCTGNKPKTVVLPSRRQRRPFAKSRDSLFIPAHLPGSLSSDIGLLLDFIGNYPLRPSGRTGNLPPAVLPELNQRLAHPITINLQRALLRDYPNIAGPYILLRVMKLVQIQGNKLSLNEPLAAVWRGFNPVEQYFTLLEAWLLRAEDKVLGQNPNHRYDDQFSSVMYFFERHLRKSWKPFMDDYGPAWECRDFSTWNAQLAFRFGMMEIKSLLPMRLVGARPKGWFLGAARRTPWADTVLETFRRFVKVQDEGEELCYYTPPAEAPFGFFQPAFQPLFPKWQRVFSLAETPPRTGLHLFKVTLCSRVGRGLVWRRLALPGTHDLHQLSSDILKAFGFYDDDHAYRFSFRDSTGKAAEFFHPFMEAGPYADEVCLEEMDLPERSTMQFLFDFGDCWQFQIVLEQVVPYGEDPMIKTGLLESHGEAPKQYPEPA